MLSPINCWIVLGSRATLVPDNRQNDAVVVPCKCLSYHVSNWCASVRPEHAGQTGMFLLAINIFLWKSTSHVMMAISVGVQENDHPG